MRFRKILAEKVADDNQNKYKLREYLSKDNLFTYKDSYIIMYIPDDWRTFVNNSTKLIRAVKSYYKDGKFPFFIDKNTHYPNKYGGEHIASLEDREDVILFFENLVKNSWLEAGLKFKEYILYYEFEDESRIDEAIMIAKKCGWRKTYSQGNKVALDEFNL